MPKKELATIAVAPILGLLAVTGRWILWPPAAYMPAPLFPLLRHSLEKDTGPEILLLFLVGVVLGALSKLPAWGIGLAAVALLPLAACAEMVADPSSHNLWPFEFVGYGVLGALVALGAAVPRIPGSLRQRSERQRRRTTSSRGPRLPSSLNDDSGE